MLPISILYYIYIIFIIIYNDYNCILYYLQLAAAATTKVNNTPTQIPSQRSRSQSPNRYYSSNNNLLDNSYYSSAGDNSSNSNNNNNGGGNYYSMNSADKKVSFIPVGSTKKGSTNPEFNVIASVSKVSNLSSCYIHMSFIYHR